MKTNPYLALRLSKAETQEGIAHHTGISKQYISMVERGMYQKPNYKLTRRLIEGTTITETELERAYKEWQKERREHTIENVDPMSLSLANDLRSRATPVAHSGASVSTSQPNYIKFRNWRETYWKSVYDFCVDFCLRTYDVTRYENGKMQGMPTVIQEVLEPFGLLRNFNTNRR